MGSGEMERERASEGGGPFARQRLGFLTSCASVN